MRDDKYVALDVHKASIVYAIRDASGKIIGNGVLETKAQTVRDFVRGLSGTIHLAFEEGTQSAWLYDLLKALVAECIVCDPRRNKLLESGSKSDDIDVDKLSELLYLKRLRAVYHGDHGTRALKELAHNYDALRSAVDCDCRHAVSLSQQAPVLDLLWVGGGPSHQLRLSV